MLVSVPLLAPHKKMCEPELCLQVKYVIDFEFKKQISAKAVANHPGLIVSSGWYCLVLCLTYFFLTECLGPCIIFPKEKSTATVLTCMIYHS